MEWFNHLAQGFGTALTLQNLMFAFAGCLVGTAMGMLPRVGPLPTMALLLPATYAMPGVAALIMLAGVYYGAQYGGSTSAILLNMAGEASSAVTVADGYPLARSGRAGVALAAAGVGSFVAGCVGTLLLAVLASAGMALASSLGPSEYFSLMVLVLVGSVVLASGSLLKALAMLVLGLLLGLMGVDANSGVARFTFAIPELNRGIGFVVLAMGVFGYGEIISNLSKPERDRGALPTSVSGLWLGKEQLRSLVPAILRGTALGSLLGLLPGGGAVVASFAAYAVEKKTPLRAGEAPFGEGNMRGVASPESANNAGAHTAFLPLLALGIPSNAVMALLVGALAIHNIQPGPQLIASQPELFWGLVASMWIGNLMLVVLNLPMVGLWVRLLLVPYRWLFPLLVLLGAVGAYSLHGSTFDVWLLGLCGAVGYGFIKLGVQPAPLLMGFMLGPIMEKYLLRTLSASHGDWSVFLTRPLSAGLLAASVLLMVVVLMPSVQSKREEAFVED